MLIREHQWSLEPLITVAPISQDKALLDAGVAQVRYVAYGVVAPILVAVGLVGNLLTLLVLTLPQFRGVTYTYFLLLALSDFFSLAFSVSFLHHLLSEASLSHATAVWYSYFELPFVNVPMSTSVFIVICITIDRFVSVCRPMDFKKFHTTRYARAGMLGSLLVAILVWCPIAFLKEPKLYTECESSSFDAPDNRTWWVACIKRNTADSPLYTAYSWIRQTLVIFLPIVVLVTLNSLTVRKFIRLRKIKEQWNGPGVQGQPSEESPRQPRDDDLVKLLLAVMMCFFVTLVPAGVSNAIYTQIYSTKMEFEIFMAVTNDLELLNHALNFYLYMMCSKSIREAIEDVISRQYARMTRSLEYLRTVVARKPSISNIIPVSSPEAATSASDIVLHRQSGREKNKSNRTDKEKTLSRITLTSDIVFDKTFNVDPSEDNDGFSHSPS